MLILRKPWTRQPQQPSVVNPRLLPYGVTDIVTRNDRFTPNGTLLYGVAQVGAAFIFGSDIYQCINTGKTVAQCVGLTDATMMVYLSWRDTTPRVGFILGGTNGGSATSRAIGLANSDSKLYFDFGSATEGAGRLSVAYTKTLKPTVLGFVSGGGRGREIWVDGVRVASSPSDATARPDFAATYYHGTPLPSTAGWSTDNFNLFWGLTANKAFPVAEMERIGREPWSIFAPQQIIIPTAVAAATAPSITALSARLITATSAQPRISYS